MGQHPSIQRAVVGIHLSLLSDRDVALLLARGGQQSGLAFHADVVARVVVLARGMPYMAQLLGLRLGQAAVGTRRHNGGCRRPPGCDERLIDDTHLRGTGHAMRR